MPSPFSRRFTKLFWRLQHALHRRQWHRPLRCEYLRYAHAHVRCLGLVGYTISCRTLLPTVYRFFSPGQQQQQQQQQDDAAGAAWQQEVAERGRRITKAIEGQESPVAVCGQDGESTGAKRRDLDRLLERLEEFDEAYKE